MSYEQLFYPHHARRCFFVAMRERNSGQKRKRATIERMKSIPKPPRFLVRFMLRLGVSVLILGGAYLFAFGAPWSSSTPVNNTSQQQIAAIRSSLNELYLAAEAIGDSSSASTAAGYSIQDARKQFTVASNALSKQLNNSPVELATPLKQDVQRSQASITDAVEQFDARYASLGKIIAYDPQSDLGNIAIKTNSDELANRAVATKKALLAIADGAGAVSANSASNQNLDVQNAGSATNPLLSAEIVSALWASAECFGSVQAQITAGQTTDATATRDRCIADYAPLKLLVSSVITAGFKDTSYQELSKSIPVLLQKLDKAADQ